MESVSWVTVTDAFILKLQGSSPAHVHSVDLVMIWMWDVGCLSQFVYCSTSVSKIEHFLNDTWFNNFLSFHYTTITKSGNAPLDLTIKTQEKALLWSNWSKERKKPLLMMHMWIMSTKERQTCNPTPTEWEDKVSHV